MSFYNDYNPKYNSLKTLELISNLKYEINHLLEKKFHLINVDPKFITNQSFDANQRAINYDNCNEKKIYYINNNLNYSLYKKVNELTALKPDQGLYCYNVLINRDCIASNTKTNYEFIYYIIFKTLFINNNLETIKNFVYDFVDCLNNTKTIKENGIKIKKIKTLTINEIFKQYPLIKTNELLEEVVLRYESVLIIHPNINNKKNIKFINDNFMYGSFVATLFVYNKVSNSIIKVLTIYNSVNKLFLENKIEEQGNLDLNLYKSLINEVNEQSDQIGIEFYFSEYLIYALSKFSIEEIIY